MQHIIIKCIQAQTDGVPQREMSLTNGVAWLARLGVAVILKIRRCREGEPEKGILIENYRDGKRQRTSIGRHWGVTRGHTGWTIAERLVRSASGGYLIRSPSSIHGHEAGPHSIASQPTFESRLKQRY